MGRLKMPDWKAAQASLVAEATKAINSFVRSHPDEISSLFCFSFDHCYGDVVICVDSIDNDILHAKRHEVQILKSWNDLLSAESAWENAVYYIRRSRLVTHNPHSAEFKYPELATIHFLDWEKFFGSDEMRGKADPIGHVIVLMQRVIESMVSSQSFDSLRMSSPFRVGVEFPTDDLGLVVMRILNWPSHRGPRV